MPWNVESRWTSKVTAESWEECLEISDSERMLLGNYGSTQLETSTSMRPDISRLRIKAPDVENWHYTQMCDGHTDAGDDIFCWNHVWAAVKNIHTCEICYKHRGIIRQPSIFRKTKQKSCLSIAKSVCLQLSSHKIYEPTTRGTRSRWRNNLIHSNNCKDTKAILLFIDKVLCISHHLSILNVKRGSFIHAPILQNTCVPWYAPTDHE